MPDIPDVILRIRLFKPGKLVSYNGRQFMVDHVRISGKKLTIFLQGLKDGIDPDYIHCEPTELNITEIRKFYNTTRNKK